MNAPAWIDAAWMASVAKIETNSQRIGATFPHASLNGRYQSQPAHWWTAGFWPGLLWLSYTETHSPELKELAETLEDQLDETVLSFFPLHHDVGFMWLLTAVARYRLFGQESARRRALLAATLLAGRFNPQGDFIRAWGTLPSQTNNAGWSIIDTMMNLSLLFWASQQTEDPRFGHIAIRHADTVLREFVRADGACHHIVSFDALTGERIEALAGQGFAPDSAWARGTAWALYGMANTYRHTKDPRYLTASQRIADFFLAALGDDPIPYWDLRLPSRQGMPRDTSAGCIAASGLIDLAQLVAGTSGSYYRDGALRILQAIVESSSSFADDEEGLVLHGTGHYPQKQNVDVALIYGDYFFLEALAKFRGQALDLW